MFWLSSHASKHVHKYHCVIAVSYASEGEVPVKILWYPE